jgi:ATP-dependent DNA helicase RecG
VLPVLALTTAIQPAVRRQDVRIALIVHTLLGTAFVTPQGLRTILQRPESECRVALDAATECRVNGLPLLERYKNVWTLSASALALVGPWLSTHPEITSGDLARLSGLSQPGALRQLTRLEEAGLLSRSPGRGRTASFLPAGSLRASSILEGDQYREAHE